MSAAVTACTAGSAALIPSSVDTSRFDGRYELVADESFGKMRQSVESEPDGSRRQLGHELMGHMKSQYANFHVSHGVIRCGTALVQEFSLLPGTLTGNTWRGKAMFHEDIEDPGDVNEVELQLSVDGDRLEFSFVNEDGTLEDPVVLRRSAK